VLTIVYATAWSMLPADGLHDFFGESDPIEMTTAIGWLAMAVWLTTDLVRRGVWHRWWPWPVLLLLFGLRELDFDKRFTAVGLLKIELYTKHASWGNRLAGVIVALLLMAVVGRILRRDLPLLWRRRRAAVQSQGSLWVFILLVVAKTLDGLDRKLAPLHVTVSPLEGRIAGTLEEMLELGAAWTAAATLWLMHRQRRRRRALPPVA